jgi:sn-glycerol 3-phosphate transport system permease protein
VRSRALGEAWRRGLEPAPYLYLAPALLFLGLFVYWPLLYNGWLSLHEWNLVSPDRRFVGLANFAALFQDPGFHRLLWQTLLYVLLALVGNFALPLLLALATLALPPRWQDLFQTLFFLPTVAAASVASLVWLYLYLPAVGPLAQLLRGLGVEAPEFLGDPAWALPAVALVANWKYLGLHYLVALAGIRALPREVLEAARVDGAEGWSLGRRVLLPLLAPTLVFLFLSTVTSALDYAFIPVDVMTQGGPFGTTSNLMYATYQEAFRFFRAGVAAAQAVLLVGIFAVFVVWQYRLLSRKDGYGPS